MFEWDSPEWRKERNEKLFHWLKNDASAVECVLALSTAAELWDDLIDKDSDIDESRIHAGFTAAMIRLHENEFWKAYHEKMMPIVIAGTNAWLDSNAMQKDGDADVRMLGFYVRMYCYEIISMAAYCAGGWDWLRQVSMEMRLFFKHDGYRP